MLNVWKNVRRYAEGGYTSIIHGKVWHEETQATASQAVAVRRPLSRRVRSTPKPQLVCDYIRRGGDRDAFLKRFENAVSPGFDPDRDLQRIGLANQTTMLMSESLEIGEMFRSARCVDRYGETELGRALSGVRHDLQRHPGSPGRRRRAAARKAGRPDDRHRRLQQQQHGEPRAHLRGVAADLSHCRSRLPGVGRRRSGTVRSASKAEVTATGLAAGGRAGVDRADVRRVDAGQPGRRGDREADRVLWLGGWPRPSQLPPRA